MAGSRGGLGSVLFGLVSLCAACCVFALMGAPARAEVTHKYLSQVTEVPVSSGAPAPGPLASVQSVAFDSGHLWVAETATDGDSRVDEFEGSTGAFVSQLVHSEGSVYYGGSLSDGGSGIAVGHGTGEALVYVERFAEGKHGVAVFSEAGGLKAVWSGAQTPAGSFGGGAADIAVDNSASPLDEGKGNVYVVVPAPLPGSQRVVDVFHPEANGEERYVGQITGISPGEHFADPLSLAVNQSNGDLVVLDSRDVGGRGVAVLDVFEPGALGSYAFVRQFAGTPSRIIYHVGSVAVDSGSGDIYVPDSDETVDQFGPTGVYLGHFGTPPGSINDIESAASVAVDSESHRIYVGDYQVGVDVFGPGVVIPDVATGPVAGLKTRGATLTGTVDPDKAGAATCQFVWGTTPAFGQVAPCSAPVLEGESPAPVEAQLTGLEPDTTYYYLLQATNANGTNPGEPSQVQRLTTRGPALGAESVSAVTAESVTFDATIDPRGAPTTYYFQYGTSSGYGSDLPVPPGGTVGAGESDVEVSRHLQELSANTVYHYRLVVLSEVEPGITEEFDGPDQTFTTQRAGGGALLLPDGRQWEMVTPPDKQGALFYGQNDGYGSSHEPLVAQASASGDAMVDSASQPTEAEPQGFANEVSVLSTRGLGGWSSQVIAPPHDEGVDASIGYGGEYRFFSEDLSLGVVWPFGNFKALSPEATEATPYLRTDYLNGNVVEHCQTSCYRPLVTAANANAGFGEETDGECAEPVCGPRFADATPDASHIVILSPVQLTSTPNEASSRERNRFYEWSGGQLQPLYLLPKSEGGVGIAGPRYLSVIAHQLSDGGSVFFASGGHLYVHDFARDESYRLDVAQGVPEPSEDKAEFLYASSDGSRVFFTDSKQLTSATGGGIYECRIVETPGVIGCELTLTGLSGGSLVGGSDDASYLYFMGAGERLIVDRYNGGEWTTTEGPTIPQDSRSGFLPPLVSALPDYRISPNGRFIAFMSDLDLTGYDNRDAVNGQPDEEVYLYDASSNRLVCASCNPTGARPVGTEYSQYGLVGGDFGLGGGLEKTGIWVASNLTRWTKFDGLGPDSVYQPRYLSDSGRLFFDSGDALVPQDVNGTQDVYEYEPVGVGDCNVSSVTYGVRSGGCVSLISSGASSEESAFMDASATGGDVFFITLSKLVPQDYDDALDVYDARECSATSLCFPSVPVSVPVCSTGDSCKAAATPQPSIFGPAPSETFSGAGNVVPSGSVPVVVQSRSSARARKLGLALRACRKKGRGRRVVCEREARRRYGAVARSRKPGLQRKGGG